MEPTVHQLQAAGYPVRRVDVDQEKDLARRFNIQSIPCFVMVANGTEVGRIVGPTSAAQLQQLMAAARVRPQEARNAMPRKADRKADLSIHSRKHKARLWRLP